MDVRRQNSVLAGVLGHIGASPAPAAAASVADIDIARTGAPTAELPPKLLNDFQVRQWITEGFLILPLSEDLSPEFHAQVHEQVEALDGQAQIGSEPPRPPPHPQRALPHPP